jgi:hypothetical protein
VVEGPGDPRGQPGLRAWERWSTAAERRKVAILDDLFAQADFDRRLYTLRAAHPHLAYELDEIARCSGVPAIAWRRSSSSGSRRRRPLRRTTPWTGIARTGGSDHHRKVIGGLKKYRRNPLPKTWLLREGWKRHGLISYREVPSANR